MAEQNKHIDDLFRDGLGDYSETPDASVWSDIEQKLDGAGATDSSSSNSAGVPGINPGRILLVLVAGVALFFTAKWATGNFGKKSAGDKPQVEIVQGQEDKYPLKPVEETPVENTQQAAQDAPVAVADEPNSSTQAPVEAIKPATIAKQEEVLNTSTAKEANSAESKPVTKAKEAKETKKEIIKEEANAAREEKKAKDESQDAKDAANPGAIIPATSVVVPKAALPAGVEKLAKEDKITAPVKPDNVKPVIVPEEPKPAPRIKEEISALFFNSAIRPLPTGDKPDVDYGMMDAGEGVSRVVKMLRKKMESGNLETGIKGGLEAGFQKYSAVKLTLSPYIQYGISKKMSVLVQPGFKFGRLSQTEIFAPSLYHRITNATVTSNHIVTKAADSLNPDTIARRYYYSQTYDSVRLGYVAKRNYFEVELPVMLQYRLTKKLSVYAGINFNFSKTIRIKEQRQEYLGLAKADSVTYQKVAVTSTAPNPPAIDTMFRYNTQGIESAEQMRAQNPTSDPLKVGYMAGFSYRIRDRWMVDVLATQILNGKGAIPNEKIRSIHMQPYVRVSIGYRLSGK
jgi:hypothetical protein